MPSLRSVDKGQVHRAFLEAFADYAMDTSGTTEERMLLRMQKNAVDYDVSPGLYDNGRLVGFTLIGLDAWGGQVTAFDAGTGIVPDFRKQGWARKMFDHALPTLCEQGVDRFVLEVLQQNEPAIKAYTRSGFAITRELRCYAGETAVLRALDAPASFGIRPVDRAALGRCEPAADWLPSFENRFSAVDAIPDGMQILGAFVEGTCAGVVAYAAPLNWLLTLLVDRAHRRCGVGTALLRHLAGTLPESREQLTALNIDGDDTGAQAFFESLGFTHLVDQYEMARPL